MKSILSEPLEPLQLQENSHLHSAPRQTELPAPSHLCYWDPLCSPHFYHLLWEISLTLLFLPHRFRPAFLWVLRISCTCLPHSTSHFMSELFVYVTLELSLGKRKILIYLRDFRAWQSPNITRRHAHAHMPPACSSSSTLLGEWYPHPLRCSGQKPGLYPQWIPHSCLLHPAKACHVYLHTHLHLWINYFPWTRSILPQPS